MRAVVLKPAIAAITGLFGSLGALFYGFGNLIPVTGLGLFLFTLLIQYGAVKIKFLAPVGTGLFLLWVFSQKEIFS